MGMYNSDKTERLNLRLTKEQMEYIVKMSEITGLSPSEYIRSAISSMMYAWKEAERSVARLENDQTNKHNKL